MYLDRTVFAKVMEVCPRLRVSEMRLVLRRRFCDAQFPAWIKFLCLGFAQLTYRESLRDIEACLRSVRGKLYHMGFRGHISRPTLADANETVDWSICAGFAQVLVATARPIHAKESLGFDLDGTGYAFHSTTIDLCLSVSVGEVPGPPKAR